jgi:hypothetical protein
MLSIIFGVIILLVLLIIAPFTGIIGGDCDTEEYNQLFVSNIGTGKAHEKVFQNIIKCNASLEYTCFENFKYFITDADCSKPTFVEFDMLVVKNDKSRMCAFEYDGVYHYIFDENGNESPEKWLASRKNDELKNSLNRTGEIRVFRLPHFAVKGQENTTEHINALERRVVSLMRAAGVLKAGVTLNDSEDGPIPEPKVDYTRGFDFGTIAFGLAEGGKRIAVMPDIKYGNTRIASIMRNWNKNHPDRKLSEIAETTKEKNIRDRNSKLYSGLNTTLHNLNLEFDSIMYRINEYKASGLNTTELTKLIPPLKLRFELYENMYYRFKNINWEATNRNCEPIEKKSEPVRQNPLLLAIKRKLTESLGKKQIIEDQPTQFPTSSSGKLLPSRSKYRENY